MQTASSPAPLVFTAGSGPVTHRVLCYGDSLTAGFYSGGQWFQPYGRALANEMAAYGVTCQVAVCGLTGKSAEEMLLGVNASLVDQCGILWKGLARTLEEDGPFDLVMLMAGTNDLPFASRRKNAAANLRALHQLCHRRGIPTVAMAPPLAPVGDASWCSNRRVLLEDMEIAFQGLAQHLTYMDPSIILSHEDPLMWDPDALHFSQIGSYMLGKSLAKLALELCDGDPASPAHTRRRGLKAPACPVSRQQLALKLASALEEVKPPTILCPCSGAELLKAA